MQQRPQFEALWIIVSHAASINGGGKARGGCKGDRRRELVINDVSWAYFYAPATRSLFIELPTEDEEAKEGEVGRLNVCLYGTRDATR